ncbi:MAG TPA: hypothetical protein VI728_04140 [Syntrophales bacterium]|nr:MAG: hypothetical protein A2Z79_09760 [Deltaproteobacteria bacterium GWA2_55_82]OGQ64978.1 MAG: hypothetical protein A3I81_01865 [Deltaproteobacteria bacterium RIFCSPLOWO2_02_FULL_55_12]OIJ73838.1 MAG: hypothetical protein A2V21_305900 [Deltaproteobacteria bacterium GWC2_55_46]HBG45756.1 hypothetical protein [Deltaproteobacteria bacterium]HLE17458.1 hypothetical protein [Syntrophales bacterium]
MKIILIAFLSIFIACVNGVAQERACLRAEAIEAEKSIPYLNSWNDIHASYKKYKHCDDGAIAEAFSDVIVRQIAFNWDQINELIDLSNIDKDFFEFVLSHIDSTAAESSIENIIINSNEQCPESAFSECTMIKNFAKKALRELKSAK